MCTQNFLDPRFLSTQNFFGPYFFNFNYLDNIFWTNFFWTKFFWVQHFYTLSFLTWNIFGSKIFRNFFIDKNSNNNNHNHNFYGLWHVSKKFWFIFMQVPEDFCWLYLNKNIFNERFTEPKYGIYSLHATTRIWILNIFVLSKLAEYKDWIYLNI